VSNTFHGRDIFAPAAAHIAAGADFRRAGPPLREMLCFPAFAGEPWDAGVLGGQVVHVDRYGNLITTIRGSQLFPRFALEVAGAVVDTHVRTFAQVKPGTVFCHVDSSGYLAVAANQGSAAAELGAGRGAAVRVVAR
jgi:S-adenosylmethionine hydrolase